MDKLYSLTYEHTNFSSDDLLKLGVLLYTNVNYNEVRFEIDNKPKVGAASYCEPELISKRIQYMIQFREFEIFVKISYGVVSHKYNAICDI